MNFSYNFHIACYLLHILEINVYIRIYYCKSLVSDAVPWTLHDTRYLGTVQQPSSRQANFLILQVNLVLLTPSSMEGTDKPR